jgi:NTE family protein
MTTHRQQPKTALVFSAGGMFGAWQVGAWRVLEPLFQPDLIVGASIGAINAWAVAGGLSAAGLEEYWLTLDVAAKHRWRIPRSLLQGCADSTRIRGVLREIAERHPPQKHLAIVATELPNLRPHIFESPNVASATECTGTAACSIPVPSGRRARLAQHESSRSTACQTSPAVLFAQRRKCLAVMYAGANP